MRAVQWGVALVVGMVLSGCGGGGGGGEKQPSVSQTQGATRPSTDPGLQLSRQSVNLSSERGDELPTTTVEGVVNGATGPVYVYLQQTNSGLLSASFAQNLANGGTLTIHGKDSLAPGRYTDTIQVDVCYDRYCNQPVQGSPKTIAVTHEVQAATPPPRTLLSATGVAFAKVPFGERLAQEVTVQESGNTPGSWTATANVPWLHVTATGPLGQKLLIEARPGTLPVGQHLGLVSVRSSNPANTQNKLIRVGLYISATASATAFSQELGSSWAIDPSRPHVYSIHGSTLAKDHVYTGQHLGSFSVPGVQFGEMVINHDGSRLLIVDADRTKVWLFDTDGDAFIGNYALPSAQSGSPEARRTPVILKVNGRDVLVIVGLNPSTYQSGYYMVDLSTGLPIAQLFNPASGYADHVRVAQDGRHFAVHTTNSPNQMIWGQLSENSKGRILRIDTAGGVMLSGDGIYLRSDYFVGESGLDTVSCQGMVTPTQDHYTLISNTLARAFNWTRPKPSNVTESVYQNCWGIEPYEGSQMLMTSYYFDEFQVRRRDGSLVASWVNDSAISSGDFKLSSDNLRVFDLRAMKDLAR